MQNEEQLKAFLIILTVAIEVNEIAETAHFNETVFNELLPSLIQFNGEQLKDYYPEINYQKALHFLIESLEKNKMKREVMNICVAMMGIGKSFNQQPQFVKLLKEKLDLLPDKIQYFGQNHDNIYAFLGETYVETVSTACAKIRINGGRHLAEKNHQDRIRTFLLLGIRAVTLWRFVFGGSTWRMVWALQFQRKALLGRLKQLQEAL